MKYQGPPLWSTGQRSWLQIQRSGFNSRRYQIWEVVGLERSPLSLVSTIEELLERKSTGFGLESREYGRWDPSRWPRGNRYSQKLTLISSTSGGRSVGLVRSRTQAKEFSFSFLYQVSWEFVKLCAIIWSAVQRRGGSLFLHKYQIPFWTLIEQRWGHLLALLV
jgi:hypothetical protein